MFVFILYYFAFSLDIYLLIYLRPCRQARVRQRPPLVHDAGEERVQQAAHARLPDGRQPERQHHLVSAPHWHASAQGELLRLAAQLESSRSDLVVVVVAAVLVEQ